MWIFDELLPKSQSSTKSGGTTGAKDPTPVEPIIISDSESIVTSNDILASIEEETPKETEPEAVTKVEETTSVIVEEEKGVTDVLISEIDDSKNTIAFLDEEKAPVPKTEDILIAPTSSEESGSPFFNMIEDTTPSSKDINFENFDTSVPTSASFQDTNEYIDHALVGVNTLMENLEKADAKKLAEEDEYTHQKEHFTELAIQAEEEHQKILAEKAHAEKVKAYLEQEKVTHEEHPTVTEAQTPMETSINPTTSETIQTEEVKIEKEIDAFTTVA